MIHLYIGEGKGKTTASIGLAIRALGWNQKVLFAQFLKSLDTGERFIFQKLDGIILVRPYMRHHKFLWHMNDTELSETKTDLEAGYKEVVSLALSGGYSLIVLDELLDLIDCGLLSEEDVVSFLNKIPASTEIVITGRKASENIIAMADYITNMNKIKHPFDSGTKARKGIEY